MNIVFFNICNINIQASDRPIYCTFEFYNEKNEQLTIRECYKAEAYIVYFLDNSRDKVTYTSPKDITKNQLKLKFEPKYDKAKSFTDYIHKVIVKPVRTVMLDSPSKGYYYFFLSGYAGLDFNREYRIPGINSPHPFETKKIIAQENCVHFYEVKVTNSLYKAIKKITNEGKGAR